MLKNILIFLLPEPNLVSVFIVIWLSVSSSHDLKEFIFNYLNILTMYGVLESLLQLLIYGIIIKFKDW